MRSTQFRRGSDRSGLNDCASKLAATSFNQVLRPLVRFTCPSARVDSWTVGSLSQKFMFHTTSGRSGQIAPLGSLSLRVLAGAVSCNVRGESEQLFVSPVSRDQVSELVLARAVAFRALDPQHDELAD